jgi:hypothetical protein
MSKKCKHCSTVVEDTISMCPNCQNLAFTEIAKVELSHEQFKELEKSISEKLSKSSRLAWRLTWRVALLIFTILGIPGVYVGWSIWSSMQGFEQTTTTNIQTQFTLLSKISSNQIAEAHSAISNDVVIKFEMFRQEASNQLALAYSSVTNQITEEFQTPRIEQTVENVAKGEAKTILEAEVQPAVNSFREDSLFIRTIARAQAYDFKAYQRLLEIGTQTNDNAKLANQVVAEIDRALELNDQSPFTVTRTFETYSGTNFYSGPFTSDELAWVFSDMEQNRTSFNREGFINTVNNLKQPLFLPQLIEFFTNETDLEVADRITTAISSITKEDFHPRDFERIQTWWNLHENEYTNWPINELNQGLSEFNMGNYTSAAKSFQLVLQLDPSADMSRAFTICCCLQTGETNKAGELTKGFKDSKTRWMQWAGAMTELETGNTSNATVQFADLTKNNPTMIALPDENNLFWTNIDWQLFHKLNSIVKQ